MAILWLISAYAIISGVLEIMAAFQVGRLTVQGWLLGVSGTLASVFGIALAIWPDTGLLSLI